MGVVYRVPCFEWGQPSRLHVIQAHRPLCKHSHWFICSSKMKVITAKWPKKWHPRKSERPLSPHTPTCLEKPLFQSLSATLSSRPCKRTRASMAVGLINFDL